MNPPYSELFAVFLFALLAILCNGAETALNTMGPIRIERYLDRLKERGDRHRFLELWLKDRNRGLSVMLVGNNIADISASAITTVLFERLLRDTPYAIWALPIAVVLVTIMMLVLGEVVPKTFAQNSPEHYLPIARVLYPMAVVLHPVTYVFTRFTEWFIHKTGGKVTLDQHVVTEEDIEDSIQRAAEQGNLDEERERLLSSVIQFEHVIVKEVMRPRQDVVGIPENASLQTVLDIITDRGFSRYPVYRDDIDHVTGVLHARDLLDWFQRAKDKSAPFRLADFLRKPLFVPESQVIRGLLQNLKRKRLHLAVVVDEFGSTAGIVTMENIVEEVFGEIYDESDVTAEGEDLVRQVGETAWEVDATVSIRDLENAIDVEFPEDDTYSTVAGFVLAQVGHIPEAGSEFTWDGLDFKVLEADTKRVIRVRIDRRPEPAEDLTQ